VLRTPLQPEVRKVSSLLYYYYFSDTLVVMCFVSFDRTMQSEAQLDCALDLMRRLPPQKIEENLSGLIDLVSAD
jgi:hypothetical protein